jgi:hypothetical protein
VAAALTLRAAATITHIDLVANRAFSGQVRVHTSVEALESGADPALQNG